MKISKKWRRMQQVYLYCAEGRFDLLEEAALAMYRHESCDEGELGRGLFGGEINWHAVAKHWLSGDVAGISPAALLRRDRSRRLEKKVSLLS